MADELCDRCGVRTAIAVVQETVDDEVPVTMRLCPVCLAANRGATSEMRRAGLFDEFFDEFFTGDDDGEHEDEREHGRGDEAIEREPPAVHEPEGDGANWDVRPAAAGAGSEPPSHIDITRLFCQATRDVLLTACRHAIDRGSSDLEPEDVLDAALRDDSVRRLLRAAEVDVESLSSQLAAETDRFERTGLPPAHPPTLSPDTKYALLEAYHSSRALGASYIGPEHLLLALTRDPETRAGELLDRAGADPDDLEAAVAARPEVTDGEPSPTPTIDQFGRDLTRMAHDGLLDPVIGRADQIEQAIEVLTRRSKNNPVLVGEAGVGKTAIVEGIAQRILDGTVPDHLVGRRVINLEVGGLLAGTRFRGDFEQRVQRILDEARAHPGSVILFIDELHTITGAGGGEGSVDAADLLKPALSRGGLQVIGATTLDEYRRTIERDPALERRFQPVHVPEPSVPEAIGILCGLKDRYEAFHRVRISDEAIEAAARMSHRYVRERSLPDKAIDLLDQAAARVRLRSAVPAGSIRVQRERVAALRRDKDQAVAAEDYERAAVLRRELDELEDQPAGGQADGHRHHAVVGPADVAEVVARTTGIPVSQLTLEERERLLHLDDLLRRKVVGQDHAIDVVADAVRRSRAGLGDPGRPVGSFLFVGPTGVGKTELARALAQTLYGDEAALIRLDMSEFQEPHTVSRLIGSPPGYVGHDEAGQLTEQIRRRPYAVLLFDEVDKAHPDVANVLLQVLDDGRLTDARGRTADCRNTVVILTANVGAERLHGAATRIGFRRTGDDGPPEPADPLRGELGQDLRRQFRPELLNRIDDIVAFRPLGSDDLRRITGLLVDVTVRQLDARRVSLDLTDDAIDHVVAAGSDAEFGARPLRRAIQRHLETPLSRLVLDGRLEGGDAVRIDVDGGRLRFTVDRGAYRPSVLGAPTPASPA